MCSLHLIAVKWKRKNWRFFLFHFTAIRCNEIYSFSLRNSMKQHTPYSLNDAFSVIFLLLNFTRSNIFISKKGLIGSKKGWRITTEMIYFRERTSFLHTRLITNIL